MKSIRVTQIYETEIPLTTMIGKVYAMKRKGELETGDKHIVLFRNGKAYMQRVVNGG